MAVSFVAPRLGRVVANKDHSTFYRIIGTVEDATIAYRLPPLHEVLDLCGVTAQQYEELRARYAKWQSGDSAETPLLADGTVAGGSQDGAMGYPSCLQRKPVGRMRRGARGAGARQELVVDDQVLVRALTARKVRAWEQWPVDFAYIYENSEALQRNQNLAPESSLLVASDLEEVADPCAPLVRSARDEHESTKCALFTPLVEPVAWEVWALDLGNCELEASAAQQLSLNLNLPLPMAVHLMQIYLIFGGCAEALVYAKEALCPAFKPQNKRKHMQSWASANLWYGCLEHMVQDYCRYHLQEILDLDDDCTWTKQLEQAIWQQERWDEWGEVLVQAFGGPEHSLFWQFKHSELLGVNKLALKLSLLPQIDELYPDENQQRYDINPFYHNALSPLPRRADCAYSPEVKAQLWADRDWAGVNSLLEVAALDVEQGRLPLSATVFSAPERGLGEVSLPEHTSFCSSLCDAADLALGDPRGQECYLSALASAQGEASDQGRLQGACLYATTEPGVECVRKAQELGITRFVYIQADPELGAFSIQAVDAAQEQLEVSCGQGAQSYQLMLERYSRTKRYSRVKQSDTAAADGASAEDDLSSDAVRKFAEVAKYDMAKLNKNPLSWLSTDDGKLDEAKIQSLMAMRQVMASNLSSFDSSSEALELERRKQLAEQGALSAQEAEEVETDDKFQSVMSCFGNMFLTVFEQIEAHVAQQDPALYDRLKQAADKEAQEILRQNQELRAEADAEGSASADAAAPGAAQDDPSAQHVVAPALLPALGVVTNFVQSVADQFVVEHPDSPLALSPQELAARDAHNEVLLDWAQALEERRADQAVEERRITEQDLPPLSFLAPCMGKVMASKDGRTLYRLLIKDGPCTIAYRMPPLNAMLNLCGITQAQYDELSAKYHRWSAGEEVSPLLSDGTIAGGMQFGAAGGPGITFKHIDSDTGEVKWGVNDQALLNFLRNRKIQPWEKWTSLNLELIAPSEADAPGQKVVLLSDLHEVPDPFAPLLRTPQTVLEAYKFWGFTHLVAPLDWAWLMGEASDANSEGILVFGSIALRSEVNANFFAHLYHLYCSFGMSPAAMIYAQECLFSRPFPVKNLSKLTQGSKQQELQQWAYDELWLYNADPMAQHFMWHHPQEALDWDGKSWTPTLEQLCWQPDKWECFGSLPILLFGGPEHSLLWQCMHSEVLCQPKKLLHQALTARYNATFRLYSKFDIYRRYGLNPFYSSFIWPLPRSDGHDYTEEERSQLWEECDLYGMQVVLGAAARCLDRKAYPTGASCISALESGCEEIDADHFQDPPISSCQDERLNERYECVLNLCFNCDDKQRKGATLYTTSEPNLHCVQLACRLGISRMVYAQADLEHGAFSTGAAADLPIVAKSGVRLPEYQHLVNLYYQMHPEQGPAPVLVAGPQPALELQPVPESAAAKAKKATIKAKSAAKAKTAAKASSKAAPAKKAATKTVVKKGAEGQSAKPERGAGLGLPTPQLPERRQSSLWGAAATSVNVNINLRK